MCLWASLRKFRHCTGVFGRGATKSVRSAARPFICFILVMPPRRSASLTRRSRKIPDWPPGRHTALAGMVDPSRGLILISDQFGPEVARFTGAHEVGLAILHPGRQFRERPASGPSARRDQAEFAADRFAAEFLMPRKLVVSEVREAFGPGLPIRIDEVRAFHFDAVAPSELADAPVSERRERLPPPIAISMAATSSRSISGSKCPSPPWPSA